MGKSILAAVLVGSLGLGCATLAKVKDALESGCGQVAAEGVCETGEDSVDAIIGLAQVASEVVDWFRSLARGPEVEAESSDRGDPGQGDPSV